MTTDWTDTAEKLGLVAGVLGGILVKAIATTRLLQKVPELTKEQVEEEIRKIGQLTADGVFASTEWAELERQRRAHAAAKKKK